MMNKILKILLIIFVILIVVIFLPTIYIFHN